ncbi:MAG: type IV secretion system protein [Alphaproteobacteria bacterium]|nr:type IV secretion system protein [Alphaproteobacteria bacterium]
MSSCSVQIENASAGVAAALRAVDCLSAETTAAAFTRLFGASGALTPALTALLTLYIVFFAFSLLTGRSRVSISALTPRMLTVGLVLTFATSWVAYQGVIWTLAAGAPDQIAGIVLGSQGSATQIFADRIDLLFAAISQAASSTTGLPASGGPPPVVQGSFTPANLMWLAALLLMLGTVGILVTARIALAVLLALGPVFITFLLFRGTRGLCAGWLRGVVLTAITPLFAVLGGAFMVELAVPIVGSLVGLEGINGRAAMALFVMAAVHCALMALALRVASTLVAGWKVFGLAADPDSAATGSRSVYQSAPASLGAGSSSLPGMVDRGRQPVVASVRGDAGPGSAAPAAIGGSAAMRSARSAIVGTAMQGHPANRLPPLRARGIGSRFASRPAVSRELLK